MEGSIALLAERPPIAIHPDNVFFTFGDGRLEYDCQRCGAQCCRGQGYDVHPGLELQAQLEKAAPITLFLTECERGGPHLHVRNCRPACFFLTDDGRCGVQQAYGFSAKPTTCRLFPFNRFCLAGSYLIVFPHQGLCPLAIAHPGAPSVLSSHEGLHEVMAAQGIDAHMLRSVMLPETCSAQVRLERRLLRASEAYIDASRTFAAFCDLQLTETAGDVEMAGHSTPALAFVQKVGELFGRREENMYCDIERTMLAMSTILRAELIFTPTPEGSVEGPLLPKELVPYALLTLYVIVGFARAAGMHRITYQTVSDLFREYRSLMHLGAHIDTVVAWRPGRMLDLRFSGTDDERKRYVRIVQRLLPATQERQPKTLYTILMSELPPMGLGRLLLLKRIAKKVAGVIIPVDRATAARSLRTPRANLQRWALGHASADYVAKSRYVSG